MKSLYIEDTNIQSLVYPINVKAITLKNNRRLAEIIVCPQSTFICERCADIRTLRIDYCSRVKLSGGRWDHLEINNTVLLELCNIRLGKLYANNVKSVDIEGQHNPAAKVYVTGSGRTTVTTEPLRKCMGQCEIFLTSLLGYRQIMFVSHCAYTHSVINQNNLKAINVQFSTSRHVIGGRLILYP